MTISAHSFQIRTPEGVMPHPPAIEGSWAVSVTCNGRHQVVAHFRDSRIGLTGEDLATIFVEGVRARNERRIAADAMAAPWLGARTTVDQWFAWYPVRLGALGTGRWAWLRKVARIKTGPVTIYNERDAAL